MLSHIGYDTNGGGDLQIAKDLSGVDVIVGGDSHTLLWPTPGNEPFGSAPGSYPTVVQNKAPSAAGEHSSEHTPSSEGQAFRDRTARWFA